MSSNSSQVTISYKLATLLKAYEIDTVFGLVGIPIVKFANEMINCGIRFISCRNEQSASYAASVYGYLTNKPAVLLVVGGPGLIHALAGIYNSISNRWPLIVIAGSNDDGPVQYKGTFQEMDQLSVLGEYVKFKAKLTPSNMEYVFFNAYNNALQGTPGVTYISFPGNLIEDEVHVDPELDHHLISLPKKIKCSPDDNTVARVADLIVTSRKANKNVLVVIGKGAVEYSQLLRSFIHKFNLPFLPTPMAKGVIPDDHPMNVSSARSQALQMADIVLVLGARLNWILHFAEPPKWKREAIFIQCDMDAETLGWNNARNVSFSLLGDIGLTVRSLMQHMTQQDGDFRYPALPESLRAKISKNQDRLNTMEHTRNEKGELNYHTVYRVVREALDDSRTFIVCEGANTMDKARISFPTSFPKRRLDCGTTGTMGVGMGYTLAAKLAHPELDVVLIQGDSAFGFSGMELETISRNKLGVVIVLMNNSGIYHGNNPHTSTKLTEQCRYDLMARGLGGQGYLVKTLEDLSVKFKQALIDARERNVFTLLNVIIEHGGNSEVTFAWQNRPRV